MGGYLGLPELLASDLPTVRQLVKEVLDGGLANALVEVLEDVFRSVCVGRGGWVGG